MSGEDTIYHPVYEPGSPVITAHGHLANQNLGIHNLHLVFQISDTFPHYYIQHLRKNSQRLNTWSLVCLSMICLKLFRHLGYIFMGNWSTVGQGVHWDVDVK